LLSFQCEVQTARRNDWRALPGGGRPIWHIGHPPIHKTRHAGDLLHAGALTRTLSSTLETAADRNVRDTSSFFRRATLVLTRPPEAGAVRQPPEQAPLDD